MLVEACVVDRKRCLPRDPLGTLDRGVVDSVSHAHRDDEQGAEHLGRRRDRDEGSGPAPLEERDQRRRGAPDPVQISSRQHDWLDQPEQPLNRTCTERERTSDDGADDVLHARIDDVNCARYE